MAIAGLWREGQGNQPPSFTMLTTAPGPDVAAVPRPPGWRCCGPPEWAAWINLTAPEAELLKPLPGGSLAVENGATG